MEYIKCVLCNNVASEEHHCIFRSKNPSLIKSKANLVPLCHSCHTKIHFSNNGEGIKLDHKLKLQFQNKLEILFDKEYLSYQDIKQVLQISDRCMKTLLKTLPVKNNLYNREEVIRKCMGGKLYE